MREQPPKEGPDEIAPLIRKTIDQLTNDRPTLPQFLERLKRSGIQAVASIQKSGRFNGISYELDGILIKGSDLGRGYTAQGLQKYKGLHYDPHEHRALLEEAAKYARDRGLIRAETLRPPSRDRAERIRQYDG